MQSNSGQKLIPLQSQAGNKAACSSCAHLQSCLPGSMVGSNLLTAFEGMVVSSQIIERSKPLFMAGDVFSELHIIKSGTFKAVIGNKASAILGFNFPTNIVGLDSVSTGIHPYSLIALERAVVCSFNYHEMADKFQRLPGFGVSIINAMSAQIATTLSLFLVIQGGTVLQRVATFLLYVAEQYDCRNLESVNIVLPMGRTDISKFLGISAESLSRTLTHLTKTGNLRVNNRRITLIDRDALAEVAADSATTKDSFSC